VKDNLITIEIFGNEKYIIFYIGAINILKIKNDTAKIN